MPLEFKPGIYRPGQLIEWPRPIPVIRLTENWDSERYKVPTADGDTTLGHSRNGLDVAIQGQVGQHHGELRLAEEEMFSTLLTLRDALHVGSSQSKFWLLLYYNPVNQCYYHWRGCATVRLEYDLSDPHLFNYSATIHADDPVLYVTTLPL